MVAAVGPVIVGANMMTAPASNHYAIVPDNSTNFAAPFRGIYVGVSAPGDIVIVSPSGVAVTYVAVPQGKILPVQGVRVNSTGTTASSLVALV